MARAAMQLNLSRDAAGHPRVKAVLLYLQENSKYPLAVGLAFYTSEHDVAYNLLMAAATLVVLPVVVIFILAQRFFVEGITVGGVKG